MFGMNGISRIQQLDVRRDRFSFVVPHKGLTGPVTVTKPGSGIDVQIVRRGISRRSTKEEST